LWRCRKKNVGVQEETALKIIHYEKSRSRSNYCVPKIKIQKENSKAHPE